MAEPFRSPHWGLWIQPDGPNTEMRYLGCHDLDDIESSRGGIGEIIRCFRADGNGWDVLTTTRTPPEPITTKVTGLIYQTADWMESVVDTGCPFPLYVNGKLCPPYDVFAGGARTFALARSEVSVETLIGLSKREEDVISEQAFDITAWPPISRYRPLTAGRQDIAEVSDINDIAFCTVPKCADSCGPAASVCTSGLVVTDALSASPANVADVWYTTDGGTTWVLAASDPFGAAEDIMSATCFPMSSTVTRWLVVREAVAGGPAEVAYSDDSGANWTNVNLATTNNSGARYGGALFSFDQYHIWLVLGGPASAYGYIFFSDDGGVTWTEQAGGAGGIIGSDLYAVWFSDTQAGMAVGLGDIVYVTDNGGATWAAGTATGSAAGLKAVTENGGGGIWWVGTATGRLYYSSDHGTTWDERTFPLSGTGNIGDVRFTDTLCGWFAHNLAGISGRFYRTKNGGTDWEETNRVTNLGYNAIWDCNINLAFAAGNVEDGTPVIVKASG